MENLMTSNKTTRATIIFVHGAWVDGSSWAPSITALTNRGYEVIAAPIPLTSLRDDTAALQGLIDRTSGPVILVGHAYAGAVISGVRADRVSALIYVAGLAPAEGETVADVFYRGEAHPNAPKLAPDADGRIWLPTEAFKDAFAPHASAEALNVLRAVQRPISVPCIQQPMGPTLWSSVPSWYLLAQDDRMIPPDTQGFIAQRMKATIRPEAVDHCPMVTASSRVTELVDEVAMATAAY
jgi:pimeloyl-ACP methyl ester carboxylesterase